MQPKILIITVVYDTSLKDSNIYKSLLENYPYVFIYDNSPEPRIPDILPDGWTYRSDPSNPGLSKAYNEGAKYARANGFDHILITDQDTLFPQNAIEIYTEALHSNPGIRMVIPHVLASADLYLSPVPLRHYMPTLKKTAPKGIINLNKYAVINSGMCVNVDAFFRAGGYNEDVFLDYSDFQFIDRFSNIYPQAAVVPLTLRQNFSALTQSKPQMLGRYKLACQSIRNFTPHRHSDKFFIAVSVIKRMLSLILITKSLKPVSIFFTYFVCKSKRI